MNFKFFLTYNFDRKYLKMPMIYARFFYCFRSLEGFLMILLQLLYPIYRFIKSRFKLFIYNILIFFYVTRQANKHTAPSGK